MMQHIPGTKAYRARRKSLSSISYNDTQPDFSTMPATSRVDAGSQSSHFSYHAARASLAAREENNFVHEGPLTSQTSRSLSLGRGSRTRPMRHTLRSNTKERLSFGGRKSQPSQPAVPAERLPDRYVNNAGPDLAPEIAHNIEHDGLWAPDNEHANVGRELDSQNPGFANNQSSPGRKHSQEQRTPARHPPLTSSYGGYGYGSQGYQSHSIRDGGPERSILKGSTRYETENSDSSTEEARPPEYFFAGPSVDAKSKRSRESHRDGTRQSSGAGGPPDGSTRSVTPRQETHLESVGRTNDMHTESDYQRNTRVDKYSTNSHQQKTINASPRETISRKIPGTLSNRHSINRRPLETAMAPNANANQNQAAEINNNEENFHETTLATNKYTSPTNVDQVFHDRHRDNFASAGDAYLESSPTLSTPRHKVDKEWNSRIDSSEYTKPEGAKNIIHDRNRNTSHLPGKVDTNTNGSRVSDQFRTSLGDGNNTEVTIIPDRSTKHPRTYSTRVTSGEGQEPTLHEVAVPQSGFDNEFHDANYGNTAGHLGADSLERPSTNRFESQQTNSRKPRRTSNTLTTPTETQKHVHRPEHTSRSQADADYFNHGSIGKIVKNALLPHQSQHNMTASSATMMATPKSVSNTFSNEGVQRDGNKSVSASSGKAEQLLAVTKTRASSQQPDYSTTSAPSSTFKSARWGIVHFGKYNACTYNHASEAGSKYPYGKGLDYNLRPIQNAMNRGHPLMDKNGEKNYDAQTTGEGPFSSSQPE